MSPTQSPIVLAEADFVLNAEGVPYSQQFGDVYHSGEGGPEQARHVFLAGNGLPERWRGRRQFTILETGFGLGLNFLETWRALEDTADGPSRLHFVSVENRPLSRDSLAQAHARWPGHAARSQALLQAWPLPIKGFHRLDFWSGRIALTLLLGDAGELLPQLVAGVDACYLDGFAPRANPQMWSAKVFAQLARLAHPGATLATWSVAASVRDGLAAAGFAVEKRRGYGAKRDMLAGEFRGRPSEAAAAPARERRAMVIGAGLAGAACADRLAARGWEVEVLERHATPAQEGSGNPAGLLTPLINFADTPNAQLSRLAFAHARRRIAALGEGVVLGEAGVLRIARTPREAERWERLLAERAYPASLARYADTRAAQAIAGRVVSRPGVWFATGTTVDPAALCAAQLAQARIAARYGVGVASLRRQACAWEALDGNGRVIASAPVVVVACAFNSLALLQAPVSPLLPHLRLETARGQITLLPADAARRLNVPVAGESHAIPLPDGRLLIGATFQPLDTEAALRDEDHAANLQHIETLLPGLCEGITAQGLTGRVGFRTVTHDRMPVFGSASDAQNEVAIRTEGLYLATGLGARGIAWAPLGAELVASQVCGEPWPLAKALAAEISAARFRPRAAA